jgi:hypothetical protein
MKIAITAGHLLFQRDEVERPKTNPMKRRQGRRLTVRRHRTRH